MKKLIIIFAFLFTSINAFANMNDCVNASKNENWKNVIEYCKPLANNSKDALLLTGNAYAQLEDGKQAQKYLQEYMSKYSKNETNNTILSNAYMTLGNLYYYKDNYGATRDIKKGLKYITKGAKLGNPTAARQLGSFYGLEKSKDIKTNIILNYYWTTIAGINGDKQKAYKFNVIKENYNTFREQYPYCIAAGDNLLAIAYINGKDGLPKDSNQAKNYLIQAIELYKEAKQPSEDELKYCPPQKGLDLASAEKLLEEIK